MKKLYVFFVFTINLTFGQSVTISPDEVIKSGDSPPNDITLNRYNNTVAVISGRKASGTNVAPTNTVSETELFRIGAGGYYNNQFTATRSRISFMTTEAWSNLGNGVKMTFSTTQNGALGATERMVINHDGRVGIGVLNPNDLLDINGRARIRHNGITAGIWMSNASNDLGAADGAFYGLETATVGAERAGIWIGGAWRFYIDRSGNTHVTGNIRSANLAGTGTRNVYADASGTLTTGASQNVINITPLDFQYSFPSGSFNNITFDYHEIYANGTAPIPYHVRAPLHLPHGATITGFSTTLTDNSNAYYIQASINTTPKDRSFAYDELMIANTSSNSSSSNFVNVNATGSSFVVDNENYYYYYTVTVLAGPSSLGVWSNALRAGMAVIRFTF